MLLTPEIHDLIDRALQEDLGIGDATTAALVPPDLQATATLFAKQPGVLCGVEVAAAVFQRVDPSLSTELVLRDGDFMERGGVALRVDGSAGEPAYGGAHGDQLHATPERRRDSDCNLRGGRAGHRRHAY